MNNLIEKYMNVNRISMELLRLEFKISWKNFLDTDSSITALIFPGFATSFNNGSCCVAHC